MIASTIRGWQWVSAWLALFFGFSAVAHGNFETSDAAFTMQAARALWTQGDSGLRRPDQGGELPGEQAGALWIHHHEQLGVRPDGSRDDGTRRDGKIGQNGLAYVWYPIGHVWLLLPFVAAGEALATVMPGAEAAYRQRIGVGAHASAADLLVRSDYLEATPVVVQGLIALTVPAACMATSVLLLFLLARALGAGGRDAGITALAIAASTQCFSLGRETLSDGPGLMAFLATLWAVVRIHRGRSSPMLAAAAGLAAGAAVLLRYQTALAVLAMAVSLLLATRQQRRLRDLWWFVAGGLPALAAFLLVNWQRFGNPLVSGYPNPANWFDEPPWIGVPKILLAAGRGILWFSPLLWLALPFACRRRDVPQLRWLAWVLFVTPLLLFATARGWQGGRCWSVRYVTPGVVALLALVLPQSLPWRRWPRTWWLLVAAGVLVNLTGVVAPVRGVLQLSAQALLADAAHAVESGRLTAAAAAQIDPADVTGWHPRYSPLHVNWRYAVRSFWGDFEDEQGRPRHGSAFTIEPLFGSVASTPEQGSAPFRWEDRAGRHLWWRFWSDLYGVPGLSLVLPVVLAALWMARLGWRPLWRSS